MADLQTHLYPSRRLILFQIFGAAAVSGVNVVAQLAEAPTEINAPYVPTPESVVNAMLKLAGTNSNDTVYDLGCGDGRIVVTAAKQYGARGVGVDLNPQRIEEARANAKRAGVEDRTTFEQNNVYNADVRNATVVTLYLLPEMNRRLRPKLLKELKPGARVVSHAFDLGDWKPEKEIAVGGSRIYLWTVPSNSQISGE